MEEYEYSFKVEDIKPFIEYCECNSFILNNKVIQDRIVYENVYNNNLIARITNNKYDNKVVSIFDIKNVNENKDILKVSKESIPIEITSDNKNKIYSLIEVLGFKEVSTLERIRYEYILDDIKFEIDEYITPKMNVVAIEGNRSKVEKIYKEIL